MELTIDAGLGQLLLSAGFALGCGLEARRRARGAVAPAPRFTAWLALVAVLAGANWLALGRHPTQLVKTWDVQHALLGARFAPELGYFRLYECLLVFDDAGPGRWRGLREVSDLRRPGRRLAPAALLAGSDCAARFSPERRAAFEADVAFFAALPRQPDPFAWFTDNGFNQTPFFTALLRPVLGVVPLSYGVLATFAWLDVGLMLLALAAVGRAFGAGAGLLVAVFFFAGFSSQFALMGGSVLRFAYLALLLLAASAFRTARNARAGACLGLAALLQVFPAIYAIGLGIWGGYRWWRSRRRPAWLAPAAAGFVATGAAGLLLGAGAAGMAAWPEFLHKMTLHNTQLSQYRVGLKLPFVLTWPPAPGGVLDYPAAVAALAARLPLFLGAALSLLLGALALLPRLPALAFAVVFGSAVLYVLTPVHYYFAALALLFLVDGDAPRQGGLGAAASLARAGLFALSAGAFWIWRQSEGALALVNGYWLSPGIGGLLLLLGAALARAQPTAAAQDSRAASSS